VRNFGSGINSQRLPLGTNQKAQKRYHPIRMLETLQYRKFLTIPNLLYLEVDLCTYHVFFFVTRAKSKLPEKLRPKEKTT
jgi:hypothetical protein